MELKIDPQPFFDGFGTIVNQGLTIAWTIIDTIVFIELENPLEEVALFLVVLGAIGGGLLSLKWLKSQ